PAGLVADRPLLLLVRRLGEQEACAVAAGRSHHDPAPAHTLPLVRRILDQDEAELLGVPGDRLIVVGHDEGDQSEMLFHASAPTKNPCLITETSSGRRPTVSPSRSTRVSTSDSNLKAVPRLTRTF